MSDQESPQGDEYNERMAALRARKAKAQAHTDQIRASREQELALKELEISTANEEALAAAEDELGERGKHFDLVPSPLGVIIVKKPNPLKYRQFQDVGKFTTTTLSALVFANRHYPSDARLEEIFAEYPGLIAVAADVIADLSKGARKESEGKF